MITWVLILFAHVSAFRSGNSNTLTSVPGFITQQQCDTAGADASSKLTQGTSQVIDYVCEPQGQ